MDPKKHCQVCGNVAKSKEVYYAHYGAVCCLSCKAFFRRIFREGTRNPGKLKCQESCKADLNSASLRKCRKCRFNKCIQVGMSPQLVPDDEESKKYTYPRKSQRTISSMPEIVQSFMQSFSETALNMQQGADQRLMHQIIGGHMIGQWCLQSAKSVLMWLAQLEDMFKRFGSKSAYFMSLTPDDQYLLIMRNTRMFQNYIFGKYLGAETGLGQLTWLNIPGLNNLNPVELESLRSSSIAQWCSLGLLIPVQCDALIKTFATHVRKLSTEFKFTQCHNALIAHWLLFSTLHWSQAEIEQLQEPNRIISIAELSQTFFNTNMGDITITPIDFNMLKLAAILRKMYIAELSSFNYQVENMLKPEMRLDEVSWVEQKANLFDQAKAHIPMSVEYVHAYWQLKQGNPSMRPTLLKNGSSILAQRIGFITNKLELHLTQADKITLFQANLPLYYLVLVLKNMTCKNSKDQMEFFFGQGDMIQSYMAELEKLPMVTFEMLHGIDPLYKKHEWSIQKNLNQKLNSFLSNKEVFGLVLVLIILNNLENEELKMLRDFTHKMLLKKLQAITSSESSPEALVQDFWKNLNEYSILMRKFINEVQ